MVMRIKLISIMTSALSDYCVDGSFKFTDFLQIAGNEINFDTR